MKTFTAFICESCDAIVALPSDGKGPCDQCREKAAEEEKDADFFNDTIVAAEDAFWKVVAERYRARGVTSGDLEPSASDRFTEASTEAVAAWLAANKASAARKRRDQRSDAKDDSDPGDDGLTFAQKWDPDRSFHTYVAKATLPAGWTVTYEYPGYFSFRHKARPGFEVMATPDHEEDCTIAVDAQTDGNGGCEQSWDDLPWPLSERLQYPNGETVPRAKRGEWLAERFVAKVGVILAECEPRKLVVEIDVTGWTEDQIGTLQGHLEAQTEACDDEPVLENNHPDAKLLRNEVVSYDGKVSP